MVRKTTVFLLLCLSSVSLYAAGFTKAQDFRPATPEELAMKSVPNDAGAEAAILDWVRVDDDTTATSAEYFRIKILTEQGKKHAEVELPYVPAYPVKGKIGDISARTIRPDGTIVKFDGKIYDKVIFKAGRTALRAKTFTFTDVQPGSILEYRYQRRWSDAMLFNTYWSVQRDIPILRAKLSLLPYDSKGQFGSFFTYNGLPAGKAPKLNGKFYELELENMPALREEAFMPPDRVIRARVNFVYTDLKIKPEQFWPRQADVFANDVEKFLKGKDARDEGAKLAREADRRAALQKLYTRVQSMRNLSFEESKTEQEQRNDDVSAARNVDEVLRKGSGYSTELNRTFVALARGANFDADVVRVGARAENFFSDIIPDAEQMDTEVAVVMLDGKPLYLDPGTPRAPFGLLSWEKTSVTSIQFPKDKKPVWGQTPEQDASKALTRRRADLKLNGETLDGTVTVTYTGQEALVRRLAQYTEDEPARKKAFEEEVKGWFPDGAQLTLKELKGYDSSEGDLTATFEVSLPNAVSSAGSRTVVPLSIFAMKSPNPFAPTTRTQMIYFPYPAQEDDEIRLTLPEGTPDGALPAPKEITAGAFKYSAKTSRTGNVITFNRVAAIDGMMFDAKHYTALRRFFSNVADADQISLILGGAK